MATPAQIDANRMNAQLSTGPRTPEGKAAVSQNRTTHGLTGAFRVLPCEDEREYTLLLLGYENEYNPRTSTERFLVTELAQAQWRIMRADAIEAELLNPGDNPTYAAVAAAFRDSDALTRLNRYAQAARRAYYKAHETLQAIRRDAARTQHRVVQPPVPVKLAVVPEPPASPMPIHLQRELEAHRRRYPDFDPVLDASQMSKHLRKWFEKHPAA